MTSGIQNHSGFATDHFKNDDCSFGNPVNAVIPDHRWAHCGCPAHFHRSDFAFQGVVVVLQSDYVRISYEFRYKYAFPPLGCEGSKEMGISRKSLVRGLKISREKASQR